MEQSDSIKELAAALAKAQAQLKAAEMTAVNPFLKNKYANLGECFKASRSALSDNGLSLVQPVSTTLDSVIVSTQLMHESGEWIRETMVFPLGEARGKSLAQEAGSIITYLRRYGMSSMIGIYADDDTDGNEQQKPAQQDAKKQPAPRRSTPEPEPQFAPVQPEAAYADAYEAACNMVYAEKKMGQHNTDNLKKFRAAYETAQAEGKPITPEKTAAYDAALVIINHREGTA